MNHPHYVSRISFHHSSNLYILVFVFILIFLSFPAIYRKRFSPRVIHSILQTSKPWKDDPTSPVITTPTNLPTIGLSHPRPPPKSPADTLAETRAIMDARVHTRPNHTSRGTITIVPFPPLLPGPYVELETPFFLSYAALSLCKWPRPERGFASIRAADMNANMSSCFPDTEVCVFSKKRTTPFK